MFTSTGCIFRMELRASVIGANGQPMTEADFDQMVNEAEAREAEAQSAD